MKAKLLHPTDATLTSQERGAQNSRNHLSSEGNGSFWSWMEQQVEEKKGRKWR